MSFEHTQAVSKKNYKYIVSTTQYHKIKVILEIGKTLQCIMLNTECSSYRGNFLMLFRYEYSGARCKQVFTSICG